MLTNLGFSSLGDFAAAFGGLQGELPDKELLAAAAIAEVCDRVGG